MPRHGHSPLIATDVPPRTRASNYPEPYASRVEGRQKRQLGDAFGLSRFGVNLTTLAPGAQSALLHRHGQQEEFVYILSGMPTLRTGEEEFQMSPGMCAGFLPTGSAHHLVNNSGEIVRYLEIGDRNPGDYVVYPEDDLEAVYSEGNWKFTRKDGSAC